MNKFKDLFLHDPNVTYLNHGSYGACAKPVFEAYQRWQRKIESQPVNFFSNVLFEELRRVRKEVGIFINADPDSIVFIPNATMAVNAVANSLSLQKGDEVLATDHEYGACNNIWERVCEQKGAAYIRQAIPLPFESEDTVVDQLWQGVTPRTRAIFISHISSSTAQCFPVQKICKRARQSGIVTIIDGAHTLGQIDLDINKMNPDYYTSNAHKWLCTPKGSAFLYVRKELQDSVEPLITGWGAGDERDFECGSSFLNNYQWLGTDDPSAYLCIPDAITFQKENNWPEVRRECHATLKGALEELNKITGMKSMYSGDSRYHQMGIFQIPIESDNILAVKKNFYDKHRIEIPFIRWNGKLFMRLSFQPYNTWEDVERLLAAVKDVIK